MPASNHKDVFSVWVLTEIVLSDAWKLLHQQERLDAFKTLNIERDVSQVSLVSSCRGWNQFMQNRSYKYFRDSQTQIFSVSIGKIFFHFPATFHFCVGRIVIGICRKEARTCVSYFFFIAFLYKQNNGAGIRGGIMREQYSNTLLMLKQYLIELLHHCSMPTLPGLKNNRCKGKGLIRSCI